MSGFSAVTRIGFLSIFARMEASFTWISDTEISARLRDAEARMRMDSSRLCATTGSITFSSKFPDAPPIVIVASLPITCAQTIAIDSSATGFTFPGMIDDPGCNA